MLFWLYHQSQQQFALATDGSVWTRITLRAAIAAICSFALAVFLGPRLIGWLRARFLEPIVSDSPRVVELHEHKRRTPTMGGLFIVGAIVAATLLIADLTNPYVMASLLLVLGYTVIGGYDDLRKLTTGRGISARTKLIGQTAVGFVTATLVYSVHQNVPGGLLLHVPWTSTTVALGVWFIPIATLVMVGASNAVNVTDGLDGLACGCLIGSAGAMAYVAGHAELADYLAVQAVPGAGELTVIVGAVIGAVLGFLWFNCHPAQVFMGDTGSLPLGGFLGLLAIVARQELLLIIAAGVFVAEAASVLLQVGWYRWRRRRVFLCAPLHHHFQFKGWSETKIVVRFWIASALCAILGLACLKGNPVDRPSADATGVSAQVLTSTASKMEFTSSEP